MSAQNVTIPVSALQFLKTLKENNNRDWFNANKDFYLEQLGHIERFADALLGKMNTHDVIETVSGKKSLHRIYRDTRFSQDKTPYKTNWSGGFTRATALRRGGYYFNFEPGNSFIAGGFWAPEPKDMKLIRDDISFDPKPIREIIGSATFRETFGSLQGEQLKTTPKGFDPGDEAIDLLRYKQFLLQHQFTDQEVTSDGFLEAANQTFINMRPFFDYMSEVLASNADGSSLG